MKSYEPDPLNCLTPPDMSGWYAQGYRYQFMDRSGMWRATKEKPEINDDGWLLCYSDDWIICKGTGGYEHTHFSIETCKKTLREIQTKDDYCHVCENRGQTLNDCVACGRPATSPLAVMMDKSDMKRTDHVHVTSPESGIRPYRATYVFPVADVVKPVDLMGIDWASPINPRVNAWRRMRSLVDSSCTLGSTGFEHSNARPSISELPEHFNLSEDALEQILITIGTLKDDRGIPMECCLDPVYALLKRYDS